MSKVEYSNEKIAVSPFFGGTGVSSVQAQAKACGYQILPCKYFVQFNTLGLTCNWYYLCSRAAGLGPGRFLVGRVLQDAPDLRVQGAGLHFVTGDQMVHETTFGGGAIAFAINSFRLEVLKSP